jgi:LmbE family N-acetylglucosaminyl deacetylase
MKMERVLVVAAHPDDEVLGCGALIHKLVSQGVALKVLVLGEGSTCRYGSDEIKSESALLAIQQRLGFAQEAMKVLGVEDAAFLDYPCGRFDTVPLIDLGKSIESVIVEFQPDTVFTHSPFDVNNDHRLAFQATLQATRPIPGHVVRSVLSYEVLSSSEWGFVTNFKPNYFVDVESSINKKIDAFNCYEATEGGKFPFPRSSEGLMTLAKQRGMQVGIKFAEAFSIVRGFQG